MVAGIVVSLAACLVAFVLLYRLALRRFPEEVAARAVLFLAVFPTAFFLQADLQRGALPRAGTRRVPLCRTGSLRPGGRVDGAGHPDAPDRARARAGTARHGVAGAGTNAGTRVSWPQRRQRSGSTAFSLRQQLGRPFAFLHTDDQWYRETSTLGPLGGLLDAAHAAWAGVLQLTVGSAENWYWVEEAGGFGRADEPRSVRLSRAPRRPRLRRVGLASARPTGFFLRGERRARTERAHAGLPASLAAPVRARRLPGLPGARARGPLEAGRVGESSSISSLLIPACTVIQWVLWRWVA